MLAVGPFYSGLNRKLLHENLNKTPVMRLLCTDFMIAPPAF